MEQKLNERIMEIAVQRGFLIPSAELYGSPAGFFDYGPVGASMKRKMQNIWREIFITRAGNLEIESSLIVPHDVLVASGHVLSFSDFMVECKKEGKKFRADKLLEDETMKSWEGKKKEEVEKGLAENKIKCPDCKGELGHVSSFNLMFATSVGAGGEKNAYLRPETAQGIFLDFKRIFMQNGSKLPLAIGQVGKSFRNEIAPRQSLVRMREFTQMELEYFFNPALDLMEEFEALKGKKLRIKPPADGDVELEADEYSLQEAIERKFVANQIMAVMLYWQEELYLRWGLDRNKFHFAVLPPDALPHYSKANVDLEVQTSYGTIETAGTAYRTDFDLSSHAKMTGQDLSVVISEEGNKKIIPHVIEPSLGLDRPFYCILEHCYRPSTKEKEWEWFAFPPEIAPYIAGVFPLMKKDRLPEIGEGIIRQLREAGLDAYYSQTGSIGKRYARADEIGVPYCITIDYQTKEDGTVTVRYRDDGGQERLKVSELAHKLNELVKRKQTSLK